MPACALRPADKKALIGTVGEDLVRHHGKKKYYPPQDVRRSLERTHNPLDVHCWAYCIFTSPEDFKALHDDAGENCDYVAMKAEILADLAGESSFSWLDIDLSWLEWPDIDLSGIFDWFDLTP